MSIPILYESGTTDFWNMGLGPLSDTLEATVTEQRNGEFYLDLSYPIDGARANELKNNRIIVADAGHSLKAQQFDITEVQRGLTKLTVHAEHVSYRTSRYPLTPTFKYTGNADGAIRAWQKAIVVDNNITADSDISTTGTVNLTIDKAQNARQVLGGVEGSILDVYGGEYRFDNEHISLLNHRGSVVNTLLAYGRNITDFNQEEAIGETYTSIYPYALVTKPGEDEATLITLPEYYVDGDYVKNFPQRRVLPVDLSSKFGDKNPTTVDGLRTAAKVYVKANQVGVPKVSTTISFVDLSKTTDYADVAGLEEVNLCDEVPFWFSKYDIRTTAKVSSVVWNVLSDSYNSITFGDLAASLSESIQTIATQTASQEASKAIITVLQGADGLTNNFYSDGVSTSPTAKKIGDRWFAKNGDKTSLYIWDGVAWREVVSTDTADKIAADIDAKMEQLNADMSATDENLKAAKQDVADLQVKLKANDDTQVQLKDDLSANSTILEKAQADIVTNTQALSDLDAKLKANDDAQAQLKIDLEANAKVQDQLTNDLAANTKLVNANKESVDAALATVNKTLTQAQADTATAVKNADLAVNNAQSAVDASGLATQTANAASDAALAAKNLATSTANSFATVQSQAATAASDAADAISAANKAQGDATSALGNSTTAISNAQDVLNKYNNLSVGGTNLILNSSTPQVLRRPDDNPSYPRWVGRPIYTGLKNNETYTFSALVTAETTDKSAEKWGIRIFQKNGNHAATATNFDANTGKRQSFTFTTPDDGISYDVWIYAGGVGVGYTPSDLKIVVTVSDYKLETGTMATDWSPAPEDVQVQISNINGELSQKVSQTDYDNLQGTVTSQGTSITANSKEIALAAKQSVVDTLAKQVTDNTSQLKLTATAASLEVTSKKVATLSQTVTNQGARLDLTAASAQLKVTDNKVDALNKTVGENSAQLKLTATSAALETQSERVDTISGAVSQNQADIKAANGAIELKANSSTVDTLSNTVKQQGIDIKAAQGQLALKLTQSDLDKGLNGYATQTWAQNQITATASEWSTKLTSVEGKVNGMQVGGRNLIVHKGEIKDQWIDTSGNILKSSGMNIAMMADKIAVTPGESLVFHQWIVKDASNDVFHWGWYDKNGEYLSREANSSTIPFVKTVPQNAYYLWVSYGLTGNVKIERGTIATDWSPAPEDLEGYTDSKVAELKLTVDGLTGTFAKQTDLNTANTQIKATADGLSAVTTVIGPDAEKITSLIADANGLSSTVQALQTNTAINSKNLIQNGNFANGISGWTLDGVTANPSPTPGMETVVGVSGLMRMYENNNALAHFSPGKSYSISFYAYSAIDGTKMQIGEYSNPASFTLTTQKKYYTVTCKRGDNHSDALSVVAPTAGIAIADICLVAGDAPMHYIPALEDSATAAQMTAITQTLNGVQTLAQNAATKAETSIIAGQITSTATDLKNQISSQNTQLTNAINLRVAKTDLQQAIDTSILASGQYKDTRKDNQPPSWYWKNYPKQTAKEFKSVEAIGLPDSSTYATLDTVVPWTDPSGGPIKQTSKTTSNEYIRYSKSDTWSDWSLSVNSSNVISQINISTEGILIAGPKVHITGATTIDNAVIKSAMIDSIDATKITSGSISSDRLATTKLNADNITSGSISADRLATTKLNASNITSGSINAGLITTGVLSADMILGGTFDASKMTVKNINAGSITSGSIATALLASTKLNADNITSGSIAAARIASTDLSATNITSGTLDVGKLTVKNLSADMIASGTIDASKITVKNLSASNIIGGELDALLVNVKNLNASNIITGTLNAGLLNVVGLNADSITTGTINGTHLAINLTTGQVVFQSGQIHSTTDNIDINIDKGYMSVADSTSRVLLKGGQLQFVQPQLFDLQTTPYLSISNDGVGSNWAGATIVGRDSIMLANSANVGSDIFTWELGQNTFSGLISGKNADGTWEPTILGGAERGVVIVGGTANGQTSNNSPYIRVGASTDGQSGGNRIYMRAGYIVAPAIYRQTTGSSANVVVLNDGSLHRSTSASKYKTMIERSRSTRMAEALLSLPTAHWYDKAEIDNYSNGEQKQPPKQYFGMIAEDLAGAGLEELVQRGDDGELEGINYDRIAPALLPLLAKMKQEIEELKSAAKSA